jgi:hypothetical protein
MAAALKGDALLLMVSLLVEDPAVSSLSTDQEKGIERQRIKVRFNPDQKQLILQIPGQEPMACDSLGDGKQVMTVRTLE